MAQGKDILERVRQIEDISTLPSAFARILTLVQDESSTALDLAAEISSDQALTMRVLRTVNSSYYGFRRQIQTISDAVVLLGFSEIERLALAISVINLFGRDPETTRNLHKLWHHSLACSVAASAFELQFGSSLPAIAAAHVGGLLHDIGKAVIAQHFPEALGPILQIMNEESVSSTEAEQRVLDGVTHAEIGAVLADRWGLPPSLVEAIACHHTPERADRALVHVVHLSDVACNELGFHSVTVKYQAVPHPKSCEVLDFDAQMMDRIGGHLQRQRGLLGAVASGSLT